jgi:hypothetical protein
MIALISTCERILAERAEFSRILRFRIVAYLYPYNRSPDSPYSQSSANSEHSEIMPIRGTV